MVLLNPEPDDVQHRGRAFFSAEIQLDHQFHACLVDFSHKGLKLLNRLLFLAAAVGGFWCIIVSPRISPVIQLACRLGSFYFSGVPLAFPDHDFLKFVDRHQLDGSGPQFSDIRKLLGQRPESPFPPDFRRTVAGHPSHVAPVNNCLMKGDLRRAVSLPVKGLFIQR